MKELFILITAELFYALKRIVTSRSSSMRLLFIPGFEKLRWRIGKLLVYYNYYRAKRKVPAYRSFLKKSEGSARNFFSIPVMDKENYIKKYSIEERCVNGKIPLKGVVIDESSGSTGMPSNWVRGISEREENKKMIVFSLDQIIGDKQKFIINAFALGPWATGVNVTMSFAGHAVVKSLGPDIKKIENTLNFFGPNYNFIIMGYPPFLKLLVDCKNIDWKKFNCTFIFGGEGMSEQMRDYFLSKGIQRVYGSLGASDLELNIGAENDFTIALRKLLSANKELAAKILKHKGPLPMIFQYNPMDFYIETSEDGELLISLCRRNYVSPKIRYNIHDLGHVVRMPALKQALKELQISADTLLLPASDLPILFHYGRSDMSVAYFGCKISPLDIQELIFRIPFLTDNINSFTLFTYEDDAINKNLTICFELKENLSFIELNMVHADISKLILSELQGLNQDFRESIKMVSTGNEPKIEFYSLGEGPFKDSDIRIKNRYISKI